MGVCAQTEVRMCFQGAGATRGCRFKHRSANSSKKRPEGFKLCVCGSANKCLKPAAASCRRCGTCEVSEPGLNSFSRLLLRLLQLLLHTTTPLIPRGDAALTPEAEAAVIERMCQRGQRGAAAEAFVCWKPRF